jgi:hypothetical protein
MSKMHALAWFGFWVAVYEVYSWLFGVVFNARQS